MDGLDVPAFSSSSGQRLSSIIGVPVHEVMDTINLMDRWPGKSSGARGSRFDPTDTDAKVMQILQSPHRVKLFAGMRVAKVFGIKHVGYLFPYRTNRDPLAVWYIIPHPSGVNRWWNDIVNCKRAQAFFRQLLSEVDG